MKTTYYTDTAVLATPSETLAVGLDALLLSIPPIEHVESVRKIEDLLGLLASFHPALIVIDMAMIDREPATALEHVRNASPDSLRVLISDNMKEVRELVFESPDTVILTGTDPARLARTLEFLLSDGIAA